MDNDIFIGNDDGYTNGLYLSLFDVGDSSGDTPTPSFWVKPLLWSLSTDNTIGAANFYMIGQTMSTPRDITIPIPGENELPYSALLGFTNQDVTATATYADSISTTIGVVGPAALGEEAQKFVHKVIGSDEPQGWDTQLKNELVFRLSRARTWRTWISDSGNFDLLLNGELVLGTINSSINAGTIFRFGKKLDSSYATTLFDSSRTSNPAAATNGWFAFVGFDVGYTPNQIFTDGNTYRDSRSIDYDHEFASMSIGFTYSWRNFSLSFVAKDSGLLQNEAEEELKNLTEYGTLTVAWRL